MQRLILLAGLFFFFSMGISAQQTSDWYVGKPIKDIKFTGLEHVSENELRGIVQPYVGKEYSDELFLELQSKLYALDYFELFVPNAKAGDDDYNSLIIEFDVTERPVVERIQIRGNQSLRDPDILDVVLLKNGDMVNKTKVKLDVEAIKELYLEKGYPDVLVEGTIEENKDENTADVIFQIDEGKQTKIKSIEFSGNSFASEGTLKRKMKTKEQGLFSSGVFQESKLEEDIQSIQLYYWEHGYIDAEVVDVVREMVKDEKDEKNFLVITLYIEEGEQYIFEGIEFTGNTLFSQEELQEVVRLESGDILNLKKLEADFARITDIYYDNGYIYNEITREEIRNEEENSILYRINIVERGRAHLENIVIQGNEKTKDYVIRRELPFEVGDVFSKKNVMEGLQNLYNTQLFSVVEPTTPMGSTEGLMDLIINVEEGKTIDLNFGVTFSGAAGDFPVMGFLQIKDNNFLGRALELSAGVQASGTQQKLNFGFTDNWFLQKRILMGIDLSVEHQLSQSIKQDIISPVFDADDSNAVPDPFDGYYLFPAETEYNGTTYQAGEKFPGIPNADTIDTYGLITDYEYAVENGYSIPDSYLMEYDSWNFSLGLTSGYTWHTNAGRVSISGNPNTTLKFITYDDYIYRPYNATERENLNAGRLVNSLGLTLSWDTRDLIYTPTKGFVLKQSFKLTGGVFFGTRHYIRSSTKGELYFKLLDIPVFENWNFKTILALNSSFSMILPQLIFPEGGGTQIDTVTTREDLLYTEGMLIARGWPAHYDGKILWNNWFELRIPIIEQYLWWDFFFNAAALWETFEEFETTHIDDFMFSFGGGFRLTIPGLPIGFYFAKRFKTEDGVVDWQTGNMFNNNNTPGAGIDFVISFTYELF